jgi:hypothetical protein
LTHEHTSCCELLQAVAGKIHIFELFVEVWCEEMLEDLEEQARRKEGMPFAVFLLATTATS